MSESKIKISKGLDKSGQLSVCYTSPSLLLQLGDFTRIFKQFLSTNTPTFSLFVHFQKLNWLKKGQRPDPYFISKELLKYSPANEYQMIHFREAVESKIINVVKKR